MDIFLPLGHIVNHCEARREEIKGKLIEFYDGRSSRQLQLICIFGGGSILSDTKSDIPSCLRTTMCGQALFLDVQSAALCRKMIPLGLQTSIFKIKILIIDNVFTRQIFAVSNMIWKKSSEIKLECEKTCTFVICQEDN